MPGIFPPAVYGVFADAVLIFHVSIVAFVIGGLIVVLLGNQLAWQWVNNFWFRISHLGAIGFVVIESWFGITCPLTIFETWLRTMAGESGYGAGFVEHWLQRLLFYAAPSWVFILAYTVFALIVLYVWRRYPPQPEKERSKRLARRKK